MAKYREFLKSIIIVLGINGGTYFFIKLFINHYRVLDSFLEVPLIKQFVVFYDSWYPFIILMAFVIYLHNHEVYYKLLFTMIVSLLMSYVTFIVYPTMVTRPEVAIKDLFDLLLVITYKTDSPGVNCLPSVHCIFCFLIIYYTLFLDNLKKIYKVLIISYSLLISISTIFIMQHVVEDIIFAVIYVIIAITIVHFNYDRMKKLLHFLF